MTSNKRNGFVYAIESRDGLVKIGRSKNPNRRVRSIQTISGNSSSAFNIFGEFQNCHLVESDLHEKFRLSNVDGEWFRVSIDEVADAVRVINPKMANDSQYLSGKDSDSDIKAFATWSAYSSFMIRNPVICVIKFYHEFKGLITDWQMLTYCNEAAKFQGDKFKSIDDLHYFYSANAGLLKNKT